MENNTFKGSLFGGFNRQDVMNYIEKASRESGELLQQDQERIAALEQENGELRTRCDTLESSLKDVTASFHATQEELDAAQASYADINEALETAQRFSRQYADEIRALQETVAALQPEVEKYHTLQKNIADVEVEARHRADTVVAEAQAQAEDTLAKARAEAESLRSAAQAEAEKTQTDAGLAAAATRQKAEQHAMLKRQQLGVLLSGSQAQYQTLLEEYKSAALQAASALQKAQEQMTQMPSVFDKIGTGLRNLQASAKEKKD